MTPGGDDSGGTTVSSLVQMLFSTVYSWVVISGQGGDDLLDVVSFAISKRFELISGSDKDAYAYASLMSRHLP